MLSESVYYLRKFIPQLKNIKKYYSASNKWLVYY